MPVPCYIQQAKLSAMEKEMDQDRDRLFPGHHGGWDKPHGLSPSDFSPPPPPEPGPAPAPDAPPRP